MKALAIHAGPKARALIDREGLQPHHVRVIPAAAGGPKGLLLGPLDRFIFGDWLSRSDQPVDLVGASIGAWRMATACLENPAQALTALETAYIHQHYAPPPGQRRPTAAQVSDVFGQNLRAFYEGRVPEVLSNTRFALHIVTSRGKHLLGREHPWKTPLGYLGAFLSNAVHRKAMGAWLDRVVFSAHRAVLPFSTDDYPTQQVALNEANFNAALQASCSIPFVLQAVQDIAGGPRGAYWDGGITDYHLHLDYRNTCVGQGVVLYPHFQRAVVPGWLDKSLRWRHHASPFLDDMVVLAPQPDWVTTLPNGKLPDRTDFTRYGADLGARVACWTQAVAEASRLRDEFMTWLDKPDLSQITPL